MAIFSPFSFMARSTWVVTRFTLLCSDIVLALRFGTKLPINFILAVNLSVNLT